MRTASPSPSSACDLQEPQSRSRIEPVARLDLDGRATAPHQRVEAQAALVEQFVVRCCRRPFDGGSDAPAGFRDLLVARAGAAHRMLVGARAAEDEMCVAVDEARRDPRAAKRDDFLRPKSGELGALADAEDLAVGDRDGAIFDEPERIAGRFLEGRDVAIDEQPVPHETALRRALLLGSSRERLAKPFRTGVAARRRRRSAWSARRLRPVR